MKRKCHLTEVTFSVTKKICYQKCLRLTAGNETNNRKIYIGEKANRRCNIFYSNLTFKKLDSVPESLAGQHLGTSGFSLAVAPAWWLGLISQHVKWLLKMRHSCVKQVGKRVVLLTPCLIRAPRQKLMLSQIWHLGVKQDGKLVMLTSRFYHSFFWCFLT